MMTADIVIPSSEGTIIGHVDSIRTADDAARAIDRLLGRARPHHLPHLRTNRRPLRSTHPRLLRPLLAWDEPLSDYTCGYCDQAFVVPSLARDHEAKHEQETMPRA